MVLCSYQDQVVELFAELRKDPLASDDNMGTAKDLTNEDLAELVCAAFSCRNAKTKMGYEINWKALTTGWFVMSLNAGRASKLAGDATNNAFIDSMVELTNEYVNRQA